MGKFQRCLKVTADICAGKSLPWGAKQRVSRAVTRERGSPSLWVEFCNFLTIYCHNVNLFRRFDCTNLILSFGKFWLVSYCSLKRMIHYQAIMAIVLSVQYLSLAQLVTNLRFRDLQSERNQYHRIFFNQRDLLISGDIESNPGPR